MKNKKQFEEEGPILTNPDFFLKTCNISAWDWSSSSESSSSEDEWEKEHKQGEQLSTVEKSKERKKNIGFV